MTAEQIAKEFQGDIVPTPGVEKETFAETVEANFTPEAMLHHYFKKRENIFLTGEGGTGKSYLINRLIELHPEIDLTASTGVAALNIGGMTIHRWASLGQCGPYEGESFAAAYDRLKVTKYGTVPKGLDRIARCKGLVIDEISMIPGLLLEYLNYHCQRIRKDSAPFGGIPVIFTGDFCQLPPVRTSDEPHDWAFKTQAFKQANLKIVHLTKIHRQDDPIFTGALSRMRLGEMNRADIELFRGREKRFPQEDLTRLFTHNRDVNSWNEYMVNKAEGKAQLYRINTSGSPHEYEFLIKNILAPECLTLKPGVKVMLLVNRPEVSQFFVNGAVGTVTRTREVAADVEIEHNGQVVDEVTVEPHKWEYDKKGAAGSYITQLPLKPAYAISIHKSQGMTLESAFIDARSAREPGQAYVAFSRIKTLQGLNLRALPKVIKYSPSATDFYKSLRQHPSVGMQKKGGA